MVEIAEMERSDELTWFAYFAVVYVLLEVAYFSNARVKRMYVTNFADVQNTDARGVRFRMWPYGVLSYVILFAVVWYFVGRRAVQTGAANATFADGVYPGLSVTATLLALGVYGIYNLTNAATLRDYSNGVVIIDVLWGVFAINAVAFVAWATAKCVARFRRTNR